MFGADPGYTEIGLSGGGGTHLFAVVTAAEAQASEPQPSAWPPPCHWGWDLQLGHNWRPSREVPDASVYCWALVLSGEDEGMGGAHAHCRGRAGFAEEEGESMRMWKPLFICLQDFPAGRCKDSGIVMGPFTSEATRIPHQGRLE